MKRSIFLLGLAACLSATSMVEADPVDPVYSMGDPGTGTPVTSPNFVFGADAAGGGVFAFVNASGVLWQNLQISVIEPTNTQITFVQGLFFNTYQVSATPLSGGMSQLTIGLLNTGAGSGGIAIGEFFTINLNDLIDNTQNIDPNGSGGWGPGADFTASANAIPDAVGTSPEPASLLLLVPGLGLVLYGTRRFRNVPR